SLKAAAVRVIKNYESEWFEAGHQICTVHKSKINLISLANPVNVLALVEALEKAQQRISQLESRTVTVNLASRRLPSDYVDGEFSNDDLAAIHNACRLECKVSVEKYLSAHGIVVKWEDE
ncbi:hypothetical protein REY30_005527, partial [Klebsiella quasipneumoniae]|nr:hypothetical protein [Klebsiella quasipneumoniae]